MSKKRFIINNENEIDLVKIFSILWKEKIKLISLWIFIFLIGYFLVSLKNQKTKDLFDVKLKIEKSSVAEFIKFSFIPDLAKNDVNKLYNSDNNNNRDDQLFYTINPEIFLDRFINEFLDNEEIIYVLKNQKSLKNKLSNLSLEEQNNELYKYSKLFNIDKNYEKDYFYIEFTWHNESEIINILSEIGKLVFSNLENSFYRELQDILEIKKFNLVNSDLERIEYLQEQSEIAKEIGIRDNSERQQNNMEGNINFLPEDKISIYYQGPIYDDYLRGYKAIDKEINIIKNRKYPYLDELQKRLNSLKNSKTNWINYNLSLIETKSKLDKLDVKKNLILILVFALIFSILLILIFNLIQSRKIFKN